MNIKKYIHPIEIIKNFKQSSKIRKNKKRYLDILTSLDEEGRLKDIGLSKEGEFLYVGVNLNPELLIYDDNSRESAELKFVSDAMKKYTDFLQKEGVLDSVIADYERTQNDSYYGYVVQIKFDMRRYSKWDYRYPVIYFSSISLILAAITAFILR
jgi:hypothetical protein